MHNGLLPGENVWLLKRIWCVIENNLQTERDAVSLYMSLAKAEHNEALAGLFRQMAETERGHAAFWEAKLRDAGAEVPRSAPSWRTRTLGWLAGRFGPAFVLPTIAGLESNIGSQYDTQPEPEVVEMAAHERSHAQVFNRLARSPSGLEGTAVARFEGRHRASGGNALRAAVLGANDGLLSVFSLLMGVAGAGVGPREILLTGLAGMLAGGLSMALGEWLSVQSSREVVRASDWHRATRAGGDAGRGDGRVGADLPGEGYRARYGP